MCVCVYEFINLCFPFFIVVPGSQELCQQHRPIEAPPGGGYISSLISDQTGCGDTDTPWLVTAEVGQVIAVTLLDFALTNASLASVRKPHCHVYLILKVRTRNRIDYRQNESTC